MSRSEITRAFEITRIKSVLTDKWQTVAEVQKKVNKYFPKSNLTRARVRKLLDEMSWEPLNMVEVMIPHSGSLKKYRVVQDQKQIFKIE